MIKTSQQEIKHRWYLKHKDRILSDAKKRYQSQSELRTNIQWKYKLKRLYGLDPDEYMRMLFVQNGLCAICNKSSSRKLQVDHDHKTNRIRQLLCFKCNSALGYVNDDTQILLEMVSYLGKHSQ